MIAKKPAVFLGSSYDDLCEFPREVRRALGAELLRVQFGAMPTDYKPMPAVGKGVYEIRVRLDGAWRMLYVAKFEAAVYVLHVFQKKTQQTLKDDIDLGKVRYGMIGD
jgi:phage-related protein